MRGAGLALGALLFVAGCASTPRHISAPPMSPPPARRVAPAPPPSAHRAIELGVTAGPPIASLDIPSDSAALTAFRMSCKALVRRADGSGLTRPTDWKPACDAAGNAGGDATAFFRSWFETAIVGPGNAFATGYYEPEIEGSRTRASGYDVPVYRRPPDLVEVDPGAASGHPTGKKQRGRMQDGALVPYYDRAEIDGGALADKGLELAWAADPYELFFLEIQGSGRLHLPNGSVLRIGYDGQNGRDYVGIGRLMRERGLLTAGNASMQGMMAWLRANPDQSVPLMEENKSYVFFRELTGAGPIGALGVAVTGHASVAADPLFVPLGAPIWLSMDRPEANGLWVAQDTGGAIKGANRFDTFWGAGVAARMTAGGMSAHGQAFLLLPKGTLERLNGASDGGPPRS